MSIFNSAPVIASKPVAETMASTAYSRPLARTPADVIASIGAIQKFEAWSSLQFANPCGS
jgi:hypothetical protein